MYFLKQLLSDMFQISMIAFNNCNDCIWQLQRLHFTIVTIAFDDSNDCKENSRKVELRVKVGRGRVGWKEKQGIKSNWISMPGMKAKLLFTIKATEFQCRLPFLSFILIICPFSNNNKGRSFAADCQKLKSHDAEHNFGFLSGTNTIVDTETNTNVSSNRNTKS